MVSLQVLFGVTKCDTATVPLKRSIRGLSGSFGSPVVGDILRGVSKGVMQLTPEACTAPEAHQPQNPNSYSMAPKPPSPKP